MDGWWAIFERKKTTEGGFGLGGENQQSSIDVFFKMAMRHSYGEVRLIIECMPIYKSKLELSVSYYSVTHYTKSQQFKVITTLLLYNSSGW